MKLRNRCETTELKNINKEKRLNLLVIKKRYKGGIEKITNEKEFIEMFIGFVDGDGYINVNELKKKNPRTGIPIKSIIRINLEISLHERDEELLIYFKNKLGVGKITNRINKNQKRLTFYKRDLETVIMPLIKKYKLRFLTLNRSRQYALLYHIIKNNIIYWEDVPEYKKRPYQIKGGKWEGDESEFLKNTKVKIPLPLKSKEIIKLPFIENWIVGFTPLTDRQLSACKGYGKAAVGTLEACLQRRDGLVLRTKKEEKEE